MKRTQKDEGRRDERDMQMAKRSNGEENIIDKHPVTRLM